MGRLFSADGIRGLADRYPLRPEDLESLGRAIAAWVRAQGNESPSSLIASDTRESSQRLKHALASGLARGGVRVLDAGILPTAALSYLIASKGFFSAGVMISASHNPVEENGIKVFDARGLKLDDATENLLERLAANVYNLPFEVRPAEIQYEPDYRDYYGRMLVHEYQHIQWEHQHIVADLANGAAYRVVPAVFDRLGIRYALLNANPDGTNINVRAGSEQTRRDPRWLAAALTRYGATVGISLDGDADRVLLVDAEGRLYDGDMVLGILARRFKSLGQLRHNTVIATQMSNSGLTEFLDRCGVRLQHVRNGDKYVTAALLQQDLMLGGEEIGHIILHTDAVHVTGDGLRTALEVLSVLAAEKGTTLADLARGMCKFPQIRASVHLGFRTDIQSGSVPGLGSYLAQIQAEIQDLVRPIECRPASTEPVYRIMIEARTTPTPVLAQYAQRLGRYIQQHLGCTGWPIEVLDCTCEGGGLLVFGSV
jgi:phosphoglucosamine mutase